MSGECEGLAGGGRAGAGVVGVAFGRAAAGAGTVGTAFTRAGTVGGGAAEADANTDAAGVGSMGAAIVGAIVAEGASRADEAVETRENELTKNQPDRPRLASRSPARSARWNGKDDALFTGGAAASGAPALGKVIGSSLLIRTPLDGLDGVTVRWGSISAAGKRAA